MSNYRNVFWKHRIGWGCLYCGTCEAYCFLWGPYRDESPARACPYCGLGTTEWLTGPPPDWVIVAFDLGGHRALYPSKDGVR